jgi:hypothetical protein
LGNFDSIIEIPPTPLTDRQIRHALPVEKPTKLHDEKGLAYVAIRKTIYNDCASSSAQSVGFTLEEINELLLLNDSQDPLTARQLANEKISDIETRINRLQTMANALRQFVQQCEYGGKELPHPIILISVN